MISFIDWLNHRLRPGKGRHWSHALCLYHDEYQAWKDGYIKTRPTLRSSRQLARKIREFRREVLG